nr:hypothetical protein [Tanacetum cinerariifolium]
TYTNLFTIQCHYYERFNDAPKKEYIEGEICFVDMINREDFKDDSLNFIMQSLGYEMDNEVLFYYKIPLKSLDIGLKPLVSESDYRSFIGYVQKHKVMHVYVELVEKDEEHDSDSDSDSDNESENEIVDEEHVVDKVKININTFKFQIDEEDKSSGNYAIVPNVNVTKDNLRDLAKDLIRDHAVESKRNLHFLKNDKKRIRVVCNGVVPSKNVTIDKVQGPVVDISGKGKLVNEDAKEDKSGCRWLLYLSMGDKGKWVIRTFKDEYKCLQFRKTKYCTSSFLSKHIADLIILTPQMPIKAIQEQMQKKFHVAASKDKAFRAKAKAQVRLREDVKVQYALLRDYVCELKRCNPDTTVKIDVYGEEDLDTPTRMFRRIYVCLGALKRGFKEGGRELLSLDGAFMRGKYPGQMLTVVGVDAINGIYPVAYSIMESENQYSWTWFLKCLGDDFDLYSNSNFTFITDRQKGLLPTLAKLFPSADHRAHRDLLINNVCEVFNRQLLDVRDSPIITALEFVREYLLKRIVIVQKVIQKCDGPPTPVVAKLFDKIKVASIGCTMEWNGSELYQVKGIPKD